MKYVCLGYYDKGKFDGMTDAERNAMFDTCFAYDDHLRANGHFTGGEALQPAESALTLYWKNGKTASTDGPYAETKEQLGGILILEARDMNHAVQLIGQHPALKYGNIFEIRPAGDMSEAMKASEQRRRLTARQVSPRVRATALLPTHPPAIPSPTRIATPRKAPRSSPSGPAKNRP